MKKICIWLLAVCLALTGCAAGETAESVSQTTAETTPQTTAAPEPGMIYLYGEHHSDQAILELELELWQGYYHDQGMRHLFVEFGYFTGAYLNQWMAAEDDAILDQLFADWTGTQACTEQNRAFFKAIKETCPETVFHGTDVGHQYWSTGERYLKELREQGLEESEQYALALEAVEQGKRYYGDGVQDAVYRENTMAENFIREFEALHGENVMGIYGSAHTGLEDMVHSGQCGSMGKQLFDRYGANVASENLAERVLEEAEALRVDTMEIGGAVFQAEYFGSVDLSAMLPDYSHREFWHLADAYEQFAGYEATGNLLPQSNYPMAIREGEVYVVRYTLADGSERTEYHICDGLIWDGQLTTREVHVP